MTTRDLVRTDLYNYFDGDEDAFDECLARQQERAAVYPDEDDDVVDDDDDDDDDDEPDSDEEEDADEDDETYFDAPAPKRAKPAKKTTDGMKYSKKKKTAAKKKKASSATTFIDHALAGSGDAGDAEAIAKSLGFRGADDLRREHGRAHFLAHAKLPKSGHEIAAFSEKERIAELCGVGDLEPREMKLIQRRGKEKARELGSASGSASMRIPEGIDPVRRDALRAAGFR